MALLVKYLTGINLCAFALYALSYFLDKQYAKTRFQKVFVCLSLLGGGGGLIAGLTLFDRKMTKDNLTLWIWGGCLLVIQVLLYGLSYEFQRGGLTLDFVAFFSKHQVLIWYLILINLLAFIIYGLDKGRARKKGRRIRNCHLLGLVFLGGTIGSLWAVYFFRHKSQRDYYRVGIPLMMVMHFLFFFYMMQLPI